jgi:murein DD-endopeptidase MepM/ murein hydrolase activator NlpD
MKIIKPTKNRLVRGFTTGHKAYDFVGLNLPDEVRAGADGVIIERVDLYVNNWRNTGRLTTRDYGNYIKIKHKDGSFELHAHLKKGSSLEIGTQVKAGQIVARIGNTGNSTGPHLHSEYRNAGNINMSVEFINAPTEAPVVGSTDDWKKSYYDRVLIGLKGRELLSRDDSEYFKDNENKVWKGIDKLIEDNKAHHRGYEEFKEKYTNAQKELLLKDNEIKHIKEVADSECDKRLSDQRVECLNECEVEKKPLKENIDQLNQIIKDNVKVEKVEVETPLADRFSKKTWKEKWIGILEIWGAK